MRRFFLDIAFQGVNYCGWQKQPNALSVQQVVEEALGVIFKKSIPVVGAGRTDAGVNAYSLPAHFDISEEGIEVNLERWRRSLNGILPKDIFIHSIKEVNKNAHARFSAEYRQYIYFIARERDPFNRFYVLPLIPFPDIEKMNKAAQLLLGTYDFTSFSRLHTDTHTNICTITEARWIPAPYPNTYQFVITANRFLRNMVRAIVGTLIEIGVGKKDIESISEIIEKKDRNTAGASVKGEPLFLSKVVYPEEIYLL